MDAFTFACLNAAAVALVLIAYRRLIFSWSALGVFTLANLVFVQIGVLSIPVFSDLVSVRFSTYKLGLLTDDDLKLTIILNVWGAGIVLAAYQMTHFAFDGERFLRKGPNLLNLDPSIDRLGFAPTRLLSIAAAALLGSLAYAATSAPLILGGIQALLAGSQEGLLEARYQVSDNYVFILSVFNVLPFLGVAVQLVQRLHARPKLRTLAVLFNTCTAALLLITFHKRPLLVFLCALLLANVVTTGARAMSRPGRARSAESSSEAERRRRWPGAPRIASYVAIVFVILLVLYQLQTRAVTSVDDIQDAVVGIGTLSGIAATTILAGQAIPAVLLTHYYPALEPHYGLSNIGLIARLFGFDLYRPAYDAFDYFSVLETDTPYVDRIEGSLASPALMDFYGAFGLVGWAFGAFALGIALNRIDRAMARLRPDAGRSLLAIFLFVSAYYLSNASVANTLVGYGGAIFVILWLILRVPLRPSSEAVLSAS